MSVDNKTTNDACQLDDDPAACENHEPAGDTFRYHPNNCGPADIVRMHGDTAELLMRKTEQ